MTSHFKNQMKRNPKAHNFLSIQVLFNDRSRMSELLEIVEEVEKMGGDIDDITVQVFESEAQRTKLMSEISEEMPNELYGKYIN
jgi:hypothetical protein